MFKQIENKCNTQVIEEFINYARVVVNNDPESHVDFDNLDIDDIESEIYSSLSILLTCYNEEEYEYEGDLENDLFLCKTDVFAAFVNKLDQDYELAENSWRQIEGKLYDLLGIKDIEKDAFNARRL
jgi:hypothetical protein